MSIEWIADDAHKAFIEKTAALNSDGDLNEATTRLRIIDVILFDVLRWDRLEVEAEKYARDVGYLDYVFGKASNHSMVIEAKKEQINFVLPDHVYPAEPVHFGLIAKECPNAAA